MTHPLHGKKESERAFLDRMASLAYGVGEVLVNADDLQTLIALVRHWHGLETEAAKYVESVICLRSHAFTGEPPYVGWEGLGLALRADYDELEALRQQVKK